MREILVLITYAQKPQYFNVHADVSSGVRDISFCLNLHLHPYCVCVRACMCVYVCKSKTLTNMCICADSPESSMVDKVICFTNSYHRVLKFPHNRRCKNVSHFA